MKIRKFLFAGLTLLFTTTSCGLLRDTEYHVYDEFKEALPG